MADLWNSLLDGMGSVLAFFFAGVASYGVAIIGLTIVVRLLLFPLTAKQARSMLKMQQAAPEIKRLQAKYKEDRQKQNEEVMKFYRENKINPLAGCLPLLAQMPIFFALFAVLRSPYQHIPEGSKLYGAFCGTRTPGQCGENPEGLRFLGMDLSQAASAAQDGFTEALPYFLLIALVVLTGYLQFKQTQNRQGSQANPQMAMMGKIFPVMFAFISFTLPAGVVLYFLVSNAWQIGQQALIYGAILPAEGTGTSGGGAKEIPGKEPPTKAGDGKGRKSAAAPGSPPEKTGTASESPARKTEKKAPPKGTSSGQGARPSDGLGRAQPAGSRPRPKRRRR